MLCLIYIPFFLFHFSLFLCFFPCFSSSSPLSFCFLSIFFCFRWLTYPTLLSPLSLAFPSPFSSLPSQVDPFLFFILFSLPSLTHTHTHHYPLSITAPSLLSSRILLALPLSTSPSSFYSVFSTFLPLFSTFSRLPFLSFPFLPSPVPHCLHNVHNTHGVKTMARWVPCQTFLALVFA